jgi:hypothetical protein
VQINLSQEPETFDRQMFKNYHVFLLRWWVY